MSGSARADAVCFMMAPASFSQITFADVDRNPLIVGIFFRIDVVSVLILAKIYW